LAAITLISIASGTMLSRFLTENMLRRDAVVTSEFVRGVIGEANRKHAVKPGHTNVTALDHLLRGDVHETTDQLTEFFALIAAMPDVLHTNVYSSRRTIIWSSRPGLIGQRFVDNHELDEALAGEVVFEMGAAGDPADKKAEHAVFARADTRFVENYIPIRDEEKAKIVAVVEVYKTPDKLLEAMDHGQRMVWAGAVGGGAVLFLAMWWIARRADRIIRRQQELLIDAETYAAVGEVAMAVAHGLRNPLAAIRSSAELAIGDDPPEGLREPLGDIIQQADRLEGSVRQLLQYSNRRTEAIERVDMGVMAGDCLRGFDAQAKERKVEVVARMSVTLPLVRANVATLTQAINSIIANGLEAMPNGGELTVECACTGDGTFIELSVADKGYGLAGSDAARLFQPFETTKSAGLGLGLTLARRILERHGGSLDLTSGAEGGAVATLRVPVDRQA
jgi:two-component system sensor histidine kinase HydH